VIEVVAAGPRCLVQDLGRPGLARLGVCPSGAADRLALRRANALVGNSVGAAALEVLLGGLVLRAGSDVALGIAGADAGVPPTVWLTAGSELRLEAPRYGLLTYVAVRGGVDVPAVLGSRSTDLLGGVGPPAVTAGTQLSIGADTGPAEPLVPEVAVPTGRTSVRLLPSPRPEWFPVDGLERLRAATWLVGADSGRSAVRLDGPVVARTPGELPPEGLVPGAVQVPPSGRPVVFLADYPVTGGYPVAGVVHPEDLRLLAQSRPGDTVAFR
jgi:biotin-dependent carboxylase-like uncharacterized protein